MNVGSAGYAGRPLTKATKDKLGLGNKHRENDGPDSSIAQDNTEDTVVAVNNTDTEKKEEDTGELSKIGDCVVGEVIAPKEVDSDRMKKKPKRKFKNF